LQASQKRPNATFGKEKIVEVYADSLSDIMDGKLDDSSQSSQ
jgi:hypothetical protein